jgi:hypothetical protein
MKTSNLYTSLLIINLNFAIIDSSFLDRGISIQNILKKVKL